MSAAASALASAGGAVRRFSGRAQESMGGLRDTTAYLRQAAQAADHVRSAADPSATALREVKDKAMAAEKPLAELKGGVRTSLTGIRGIGKAAGGVRRLLGKLTSGLGSALSMLGGLVGASGPAAKLLTAFGTAMTIGSFAMDAINLVIKANPLGFVMGLLVPLLSYLIDLAMNSDTGQKIIQQVFTEAVKVFRQILTYIGPVLKVIVTAVELYFTAYWTITSGALTAAGAAISGGFNTVDAVVGGVSRLLGGIVSAAWNGLKSAVGTVLQWITKDIPDAFTRVKDATARTLNGIGGFLTAGLQSVLGAVTGAVNGLISFANWVIDGLDSLSFSFLGRTFGVQLPRIPMLAAGGVVLPGLARQAGRVRPLGELDRHLAIHVTQHRAPGRPYGPLRLRDYHESASAGAFGTAEDLLFLATAHAHAAA